MSQSIYSKRRIYFKCITCVLAPAGCLGGADAMLTAEWILWCYIQSRTWKWEKSAFLLNCTIGKVYSSYGVTGSTCCPKQFFKWNFVTGISLFSKYHMYIVDRKHSVIVLAITPFPEGNMTSAFFVKLSLIIPRPSEFKPRPLRQIGAKSLKPKKKDLKVKNRSETEKKDLKP